MVHNWREISKRYFSYKSQPFQTCPEFSSQWSSPNYLAFFLKFWVSEFLQFLFSKISNSPLYPMAKPTISITWITSDRRAKWGEYWDSQEVVNIYCTCDLWPCKVQGYFWVIQCAGDLWQNTIFRLPLFLHLWLFYSEMFYMCSPLKVHTKVISWNFDI